MYHTPKMQWRKAPAISLKIPRQVMKQMSERLNLTWGQDGAVSGASREQTPTRAGAETLREHGELGVGKVSVHDGGKGKRQSPTF